MKSNKLIKYIVIAICVIIILIILNYLYKKSYRNISKEHFAEVKTVYTGEPSLIDKSNLSPNINYKLNNLQSITSNNVGLYALTKNTSIVVFSPSEKKWIEQDIKLIKPEITNPQYDTSNENKIICKSSDGLHMTSSLNTLWLYNSFINNTTKTDCIYYLSLNNDGSIPLNSSLYCLALPLLSVRNNPTATISPNATATPTTTNSSKQLLQEFDNIRLLACNQNILFALGCYNAYTSYNIQTYTNPLPNDIGLYYCIINNGIPKDNTDKNWNYINLPNLIVRADIKKIMVNDDYIFIYTISSQSNSTYAIYYLKINIKNNKLENEPWIKVGGDSLMNKPNGINFDKLTMNNDIIWGIEQDIQNRKTNLWWCALKNKSIENDDTYIWKSITINYFEPLNTNINLSINSIMDIILYNNNLIIFSDNNESNFVIPLLGNFTTSPTFKPDATNSGSGGTSTTSSGGTSTTSSGGTSTTSSGGSGGSGGSGSGSGSGGSGSGGSGSGGSGGSGSGSSGGSGGSGSGGSGSGSGGSGSGSGGSGSGGSGSGSGGSGGIGSGGSGSGGSGGSNGSGSGGIGSILPNVDFNAQKNKHNLNNFLAKNKLIGSDVYISPMNNSGLYLPNNNNEINNNNNNIVEKNKNISSSFFPSVEYI